MQATESFRSSAGPTGHYGGGGLVRFEGTMKFGLKKQEDKINEEEISIIHPLKEIPILLMQVAGMRP